MASGIPEISKLKKKIEDLEAEALAGREARSSLEHLQRIYEETSRHTDQTARSIYFLQSAIDMPQLYLDRDWRIVGYTGDFLRICDCVVEFSRKRKHVRELLGEYGFEKIEDYFRRVRALEEMPYDNGGPWSQVYAGPIPGENIGREWVSFGRDRHWKIVRDDGAAKIVHSPHPEDVLDCYLISAAEYGGAETDLKVVYRFRTAEREDCIRDISLVISASSGREGTLPDMIGYTVCTASRGNKEARIQRQAADQVSQVESLEPGTEYEVTVERSGGRISRRLVRTADRREAPPLVFIDSSPIYDRQNHVGFCTFSGHAEIQSIRIYTRPSRFSIEQFRVRFDVEVRLEEPRASGRMYRLRLGPAHSYGETYRALLFEDITTRKKAEQLLQHSEQYFRSLTENSFEFILTISPEGLILYESPSVQRQLGFPEGFILGRHILDFVHPGDHESMRSAIGKMLEFPDRPVAEEVRILDYHGRWRFIEGIGNNMLSDPAVRGVVINARDVTERKRAERALLESEERYRNLVESMTDGVAVLNEEGRCTYVNKAVSLISGFTREQLLGSTPDLILDEKERENFWRNFDKRRLGSNEPYELIITTQDGQRKFIHTSPQGVKDEKGKFKGSIVVLRDVTEKRLAEEALLRSRAHMRAVIDGIKNRIIFVNRELEIILVNRAAARAAGKSPEELIGRKFCELWCSQEEDCEECLPQKTLLSGRSHQTTRLMPQQDGRVLDIRTDPVYNREGELLGAVVISEDITSRKRAEELMRQSETRYRLLFENAGNPIILVDHDGVLQMLNNLAAGYLGGIPENLVGKSIHEVMPMRFAKRRLQIIRSVIEDGRLLTEEFQLRLNGSRFWFKAIIQPYGYSKGINCAQMILHDITELKEAQRALQKERDGLEARVLERTAALRRSEARLQERIRELTCLYSIRQEFDRGGSLEETLARCLSHVRESLDEPDKKLVTLVLDGHEINPFEKHAHSGECLECELSVNGSVRGSLRMSYSLRNRTEFMPYEQDLIKQTVACLSDFIQNRELQDQLLQSEKLAAAGRVAAGVAHEINNPLGAIKNALFILRHAVPDSHEDYQYIELMESEVDRMASIIIQLYDLYKPSSREHQEIVLLEVVQSVLKMLNTKITRQKINVETAGECDGSTLFLPRDQVTQVLYNIILNAVQAMPSGGGLRITSLKRNGFCEVEVTDSGPGIPDDILPHIFEPFFTTKSSSHVSGQGMGMGLSLSRSVMDSFGGSISVNTRPGRGTSFTLHFPLADK